MSSSKLDPSQVLRGAPRVKVTGLRQLVRGLEQAGVQVVDLKGAFREISEKAATTERQLVPVRSGELKETIRIANRKNESAIITGFARRGNYARVVNYGAKDGSYEGSYYGERARDRTLPTAARILERNLNALLRSI